MKASKEFYMAEAMSLLQQLDVTRYMEKVTWRLNQEEARAHKFLHKSSVPKVRSHSLRKLSKSMSLRW